MNDHERYEFDRLGYLVIPALLSPTDTATLSAAIDALESRAADRATLPPRKRAVWGGDYHHDAERGVYVSGGRGDGQTLMIEDFWNADPAFDLLVDHAPTMAYIRAVIRGRVTINNSEVRIRYPNNFTGTHMGGPIDHKYRYAFTDGRIDCMMVRVVYFVHDVGPGQGAFCVVPATHKSNLPPPAGYAPDDEPGMIGLEVRAGDAILFTENLRHGGLINRSPQTRKTLHVGYGPAWMMSQNISTMDEPQNVAPQTRARWTPEQNELFLPWPRRAE